MKGYHDKLVQDPVALFNENSVVPAYPVGDISTADRITGAIMGAFIGDALGQGSLWYYDYNRLWGQYGTWMTDYQDPQKDHPANSMEEIAVYKYQAGVRAGMSSQTGQLFQLLLEHLVKENGFVGPKYAAAVTAFFDQEILPTATFSNVESEDNIVSTYAGSGVKCFSGRYTNREVRENFDLWYNNGKKDGLWWQDPVVSITSTSDGAQMAVMLAAIYRDPKMLFEKAYELLRMWYSDPAFISQAIIYAMTVQALINEIPLADLKEYFANTFIGLGEIGQRMSSFDDVTSSAKMLHVVTKPQLFDFDDRFAPLLFGTNCHIYHLLPCAYYYAYKYCDDFEKALLVAANSGGNNMARATLTGALVGAMNGIGAIPQRWITGLANEKRLIPGEYASQGEYLLHLAKQAAAQTIGEAPLFFGQTGEDCGCFI